MTVKLSRPPRYREILQYLNHNHDLDQNSFYYTLGMNVSKPYTVVPNSLLRDQLDHEVADGQVLNLMIKIYQEGDLTPLIDQVKPGERSRIIRTRDLDTWLIN